MNLKSAILHIIVAKGNTRMKSPLLTKRELPICLKSTAHKLGLFDVAISPCSISPKLTRIKVDYKMFVKVFSSDWPTLRPTFLH
jgi:hypothetical protein